MTNETTPKQTAEQAAADQESKASLWMRSHAPAWVLLEWTRAVLRASAVQGEPVARLQKIENPAFTGEELYEIVILDRERCCDDILLYAGTAEPQP